MTNTSEFHDLAKRARHVLEPDDATIDRVEGHYRELAASVRTKPAPRRARGRRLLVATTVIAAAGVIAIPFVLDAIKTVDGGGAGTSHIPLTAPQAFAHAAAAAATEDWHPLAAGEYHHVYSLDVAVPQNPWGGDDEPYVLNDEGQRSATANESWVARDGSGRYVTIEGLYGNDPDSYLSLSYNKKGYIDGFTTNNNLEGEPLPIRERIRNADIVSVLAWNDSPESSSHVSWYRQPEGYLPSRIPGSQSYIPTSAMGTTAEKFQTMAWGNTITHFDRLNALKGEKLQTELLQLIAKGPVPGQSEYELGGDTYGASREVIATEERVARAVRLLGAAPLAPHVRSAIFEWLAKQDPENVSVDAKDVMGRRGTRVTFKAQHERLVPGHTWTINEIVAAAKGKGQPVIGTLDAKPRYKVKSYTEYRKWYVDVIFDERTGRLLQEASHLKWGSDGAEPSLTWGDPNDTGRTTETKVEFRPETGVVGAGTAYLGVNRTTDFSPTSVVCQEHPKICQCGSRDFNGGEMDITSP